MGKYKILYALSTEEAEDKMNEAAQDGWRLVSLSFIHSDVRPEIVVAMEKPSIVVEEPVRYKDVPAPASA